VNIISIETLIIVLAGLVLVALCRHYDINLNRLYTENGQDVSLGRIAFWILFILACMKWTVGETANVSPQHFELLCYLLLYNVGKKGIDAWKASKEKKSDAKQ
jgi:hypothetical protein